MLSSKGMIAFAIAGITAIFLSSVVPLHAANPFSGAQSFEVTMEKEFPTTKQEPVLYTDFDISTHLDPWVDIMATQLAIWTYDRQEEAARLAMIRVRAADKFIWDLSGWTFVVMGLLAMALTGVIGFAALKKSGA